MPRRHGQCRRLRAIDGHSEVLAALKVLSVDADLPMRGTRAINRCGSLLLQIFPALERVSLEPC